jgi:glycosyltransferase involved in cell wall biosynthesis
VLLLNYEFPPAGGGAGFATFNVGRELVKLGIQVDILTARIENEANGKIIDGVRVYRVPSFRKSIHDCGLLGAYSFVAFALAKRFELLRNYAYDVEHFFFSLPTGVLTLAPFPTQRPPYLISLRGSDVPGYDPFNQTVEKMHRFLLPITCRIWRKAGAVVALSNDLKLLAMKTAPAINIDVIPNGVETETFYPPQNRRTRSPEEPVKIISVTRLLERKGLHHLMEAIAKPTALNVQLDIVGTGSYEQQLRDKCRALGLKNRIRFKGFVRREALPALYRNADLFVLPSQTESFGLVFAEAMACGLPILATSVGGIPELVRDGVDGYLVKPAHPGELRKLLKFFISHPYAGLKMGEAARLRIEEHYSWRSIATQYLEKYQEVADKLAS